jgi:hypothetical protein
MPSGTGVTSDAIPIQTAGITAYIATDYVGTGGITGHYQLIKLGYGVDGSATVVNSANPLPVTIATGMTATISGFTGTIDVRGIGGAAVVVSGSVVTTGLTSSPLFVRTFTGSQVEVTGGRYLGKSNDSVSVWGPNGLTYIYVNLVDQAGNSLSYTNGALNVNVAGATINATIPSTVTVVGLSGATAVGVNVGNTVGINDTNILTGMTAIYGQVVGLRSDLGGFAVIRPTGGTAYRLTSTTTAAAFAGFTCKSGINVKAASANTDVIYITTDTTASLTSLGYELDPGESLFIDIINSSLLAHRAKSGSQIISYLAT